MTEIWGSNGVTDRSAEVAELRAEIERLRTALKDLYNEFKQSNDFRPDSRAVRQAQNAYMRDNQQLSSENEK